MAKEVSLVSSEGTEKDKKLFEWVCRYGKRLKVERCVNSYAVKSK